MAEEIRITIATTEDVPAEKPSVTDMDDEKGEDDCETVDDLREHLEKERRKENEETMKSMQSTSFRDMLAAGLKRNEDKAMGR